jgi:hypothetical protein
MSISKMVYVIICEFDGCLDLLFQVETGKEF